MKKKVLFVIDSLVCAGAEKSLITLLNLIDYKKYNVDLQLFAYGRKLEKLLSKDVNLLDPLEYTKFTEKSIKDNLMSIRSIEDIKMLKARIKFSYTIRKKHYTNAEKARLFWQINSNVIEKSDIKYDIAISYAQGIPTFYVADKINAKKKYAWVNVSYTLNDIDREFQKQFYDKYNKIVAVSDSARDIFIETFNKYENKIKVIYDINDYNFISKMANVDKGYEDNFEGIKILTIGRLANQKGYDLALDACKRLKDEGINFRWYSLGVGPLENDIKKYITSNNLEDNFKLLGVKSNPYPYIKNCDIYVQTSRYEGFGLAIAEARMLNKPVVTTEFDAVYNQMIQEKNGLVVKMSGEAIYKGIKRIIEDEKLKNNIIEYLKNEKKGNIEELDKFYELIGEK